MTVAETVHCDLCGSDQATELHRLRDRYHDLPGDFALQRCRNCGLIYLSPRPTLESIAAYYPAAYDNYRHRSIADEPFFLMRWMRQQKLTQRRRFVERRWKRAPGTLLDVGCSTGLFLHEMRSHRWQGFGVELSTEAAGYARNRFGLTVFEGDFLGVSLEPASVDVVTFWDVLEHTHSPGMQLARAAEWLRPGGAVVISVPNWGSLDRHLFGEFWQGLDPPRHLFVFSEAHLASYLSRAGFELLHSACFAPGYFSFAMSVERWLKSVDLRLSGAVRRFLAVPGVRIPLIPWFALLNAVKAGPILTVYARKVV